MKAVRDADPAASVLIMRSRRWVSPVTVPPGDEILAVRGTATIVGVLPPDATIEFPWMAIRPECRVQTSRMGSNQFRTDIPNYLEFYRQGRLRRSGFDDQPARPSGRYERSVPRDEGRRGRAHRADVR